MHPSRQGYRLTFNPYSPSAALQGEKVDWLECTEQPTQASNKIFGIPELAIIIVLIMIDRHIYLNLSRSTQSAAQLKSLKPAANGRYLMCKSLPYTKYYYHYCNLINYLSSCSKVHAGSFHVSVIHQTLTWATGSLMYCM